MDALFCVRLGYPGETIPVISGLPVLRVGRLRVQVAATVRITGPKPTYRY